MQALQSQVKKARNFLLRLSSLFWQLKMARLTLFGRSVMNNMLRQQLHRSRLLPAS